jgi:hypothetical protein
MQAQKKTRKTKNKFASLLPQVGSSPLLSLHRRGAAQLPTPTSHIHCRPPHHRRHLNEIQGEFANCSVLFLLFYL